MKNVKTIALATVLATLTGCGGGGSSPSSQVATAAPKAQAPAASAPAPAPAPTTTPTSPAGALPVVTAADCPALQATTVAAPVIVGADMKAASDILSAVDAGQGYSEFSRLPGTFVWWLRGAGPVVDMSTLGAAAHETNHTIDNTLTSTCNTDRLARYFADGQIHVTGLTAGGTSNLSIVSETYPAALKTTRSLRFSTYITGSTSYTGNDFHMLLDELNAYSGGANFEVNLLSSSAYSYLASSGDFNLGGMTDFMLFLQSYLQAARLNHGTTYATIQSQAQTLAYMQFAWSRAERILAAAYPYSVAAGGTQVVPLDVLAQIYSPSFLAELDAMGITHQPAGAWATTYLH